MAGVADFAVGLGVGSSATDVNAGLDTPQPSFRGEYSTAPSPCKAPGRTPGHPRRRTVQFSEALCGGVGWVGCGNSAPPTHKSEVFKLMRSTSQEKNTLAQTIWRALTLRRIPDFVDNLYRLKKVGNGGKHGNFWVSCFQVNGQSW